MLCKGACGLGPTVRRFVRGGRGGMGVAVLGILFKGVLGSRWKGFWIQIMRIHGRFGSMMLLGGGGRQIGVQSTCLLRRKL